MKYTPSHEWIVVTQTPQGTTGTIGITAYAREELGDVVYIQLPPIGARVLLGQEIAVLESTKAASDIYSPITGTVVAINTALQSQPSLVNIDPENAGWLCQISLEEGEEIDLLLEEKEYLAMIGKNKTL